MNDYEINYHLFCVNYTEELEPEIIDSKYLLCWFQVDPDFDE